MLAGHRVDAIRNSKHAISIDNHQDAGEFSNCSVYNIELPSKLMVVIVKSRSFLA